jgi:protein involved in polysaccharide export with SLBB domain/glycosyltransferase involved in cell wall biosynthesis
MKRPLRILYAAGPGDVINTYRQWKEGRDDASQVSITYSGQFYDVCRELGARGYVLSSHRACGTVEDGQITIEHRAKPLPGSGGLFYHFAEIWYGLRLVATAIRFRADVVVVAEGTTHWFVLFLLPLRIKLIPAIHCVLWPKYKALSWRQRLINRLNRSLFQKRCFALLSASDEIIGQIQQITGGLARRVVHFLPTYRKETFDAIAPPPDARAPFRVLFAGRIERNKGVFDLLEIARRCKAEGRTEIEFDVCGTGTALDELRRGAEGAGISGSFRCHGHCSREVMQEMFRNAHVLIVPTTTDFIEGFNQVVVEGVLAGRPVITSSICPALSTVRDAVVEVAPDDVRGYGDAIIRLREDGQLYEEKRRACAAYQPQFYDSERGWGAALKSAVRAVVMLPLLIALLASNLMAQETKVPATIPQDGFRTPDKAKTFTSSELLAKFDAGNETVYTIGEGDELTIEVWDHQELSGKHIVGPDGKITIPQAGPVQIAGLSREEAAGAVENALSEYYRDPAVTVRVDRYTSYRVFILGRVTHPGALFFDSPPTLLDVITRAGGLPVGGSGAEKAALARCAVFRGREQVVWIELKSLLNGTNLALNIRLKRNDLVYLPDSDDQLVYVLGEVRTPGAYRLTPNMTFMDALSLAGGPTKDASTTKLHLFRPSQQIEAELSLGDLIKPGSKLNYSLNEGDVLYVPSRRLARAGYIFERVNPFAYLLLILTSLTK